jgi:uncharacterized protein
MKIEGEGQLLRIFVGESDRWEGRPLYEAIVRAAREHGLAGATALRGIEGFGASSRIHTVKVLRLSEDLPIIVEIVDRQDRIATFIPTIDKMVSEGMITLEKVNVLMYRNKAAGDSSIDDELQLESPEFSPWHDEAEAPLQMTERAQQIMESAKEAAAPSRRIYADSVDVLLAMLCHAPGAAAQSLERLGIDCASVERALRDVVDREEPSATYLTALERRSLAEATGLGDTHIGPEHLLLALCEIRPSAATDILMRLGAQPRDICKEVLELLGHCDDWQRWLADHPDM